MQALCIKKSVELFHVIDSISFFSQCDFLDCFVLRQLDHIRPNWELSWSGEPELYEPEEDSYAENLNNLIRELGSVAPPKKYHDHEDRLAEYVIAKLNWKIEKKNGRWVGQDYSSILGQGGFGDLDEENLVLAAAGRIKAAIDRGQTNFDEMEMGHQIMLADVLAVILYHRTDA